jgi:hypothetical protein
MIVLNIIKRKDLLQLLFNSIIIYAIFANGGMINGRSSFYRRYDSFFLSVLSADEIF